MVAGNSGNYKGKQERKEKMLLPRNSGLRRGNPFICKGFRRNRGKNQPEIVKHGLGTWALPFQWRVSKSHRIGAASSNERAKACITSVMHRIVK